MNWYERANHGWDGEGVLAERFPVACYLAIASPVIAVALILLAVTFYG